MSISYISQSTRTRMFDSVMISQMALVGCQASNKPKMETKYSPNEQQEVPTNPNAWDSEEKCFEGRGWHAVAKNMCCRPEPNQVLASRPATFQKKITWKCSTRFTPETRGGSACLSRASALLLLGWEQLAWATGGFSHVTTWDSERNSDQPPQHRENNMLSQLLRAILQLTRIFLVNVLSWESAQNTLPRTYQSQSALPPVLQNPPIFVWLGSFIWLNLHFLTATTWDSTRFEHRLPFVSFFRWPAAANLKADWGGPRESWKKKRPWSPSFFAVFEEKNQVQCDCHPFWWIFSEWKTKLQWFFVFFSERSPCMSRF